MLANILSAEALDSTFLSSTSAKSKSLAFTAFSNLDTGAREVWDGLVGRTEPTAHKFSSWCSSVTPGITVTQTLALLVYMYELTDNFSFARMKTLWKFTSPPAHGVVAVANNLCLKSWKILNFLPQFLNLPLPSMRGFFFYTCISCAGQNNFFYCIKVMKSNETILLMWNLKQLNTFQSSLKLSIHFPFASCQC